MVNKIRKIGFMTIFIFAIFITSTIYLKGTNISCQISGTCRYYGIDVGSISCQGGFYSINCSKGWDYIECDGNRTYCPNGSNLYY